MKLFNSAAFVIKEAEGFFHFSWAETPQRLTFSWIT